MDFKEFSAGKDDENRRLDKVIRHFIPEIPLSEVYKLLRKGLIKVNSRKSEQAYKIHEGDLIKIPAFIFENYQLHSKENKSNSTDLKLPPVIFENENILILNKPYDMLVHGDSASLDEIVKEYYQKKNSSTSLSFRTGPLHRLDRKTSGLIAFSMSLEGAQWFSENIKNHQIQKKYYGIVENWLEKDEIWQDYIEKNDTENTNFHTVKINKTEIPDSKAAFTKVTPLINTVFKNKKISLVSFDIKTGRTHQIRSQSSFHSHPLLGDTAYGGSKLTGTSQSHYLQAYEMTFPFPNSELLPEKIKIEINPAFKEIIKEIEI